MVRHWTGIGVYEFDGDALTLRDRIKVDITDELTALVAIAHSPQVLEFLRKLLTRYRPALTRPTEDGGLPRWRLPL